MDLPSAATREPTVYPAQQEVLASGILDSGFSCVLQMPTGSGKTWLAEKAIASVLARGQRAIYLTPLRALASELRERWGRVFVSHKVGAFTGETIDGRDKADVPFAQADLLVMTPERLDACTRSWRAHWAWLPEVDLVVADEFHLIGDVQRGARLEGALMRFRRLNPFARVLALSATLGNREELADWLGAVEYASNWRPIPLRWRVVRFRKSDEKPRLLAETVAATTAQNARALVFVQSRRRAEALSEFLTQQGLRAQHHHAGLSRATRQEVERACRNGTTEVLVATPTLEMGLNLPVRQVVLYDIQGFNGSEFAPLSVNTVWQRGGRAGRPGLDTEGEVVLLAPSWDRQADRLLEGRFEPIRSVLATPSRLAEQVVAEVASGLCRSERELEAALAGSLAAHQRSLPQLSCVVGSMVAAGMLRQQEREEGARTLTRLEATPLGRVAVRHLLQPETVLLFRRILERPAEPTFFDLLLTMAACPDCEPVLPADFEELDQLGADLQAQPSTLRAMTYPALADLLEQRGRSLLGALKTALVLRAWTRAADTAVVAERYGCYPFEIELLRESAERLLLAMTAVTTIGDRDDSQEAPALPSGRLLRLRALHRMVTAGIDEQAATLTFIPGIGPRTAHRLLAVGVNDIEDLAASSPEELAGRGVSADRARRWIGAAGAMIKTHSAFALQEEGGVGPIPAPLPLAAGPIDPYRLRRARELTVEPSENGGMYHVTGGLEPHLVVAAGEGLSCDCADSHHTALCKHILAVRLHRRDAALRAAQTVRPQEAAGLDLLEIWSDMPTPARRAS